jgi:flagellar biosynthetic protein FlhB
VGLCVLPSAVGSLWNYGKLHLQRAIQAGRNNAVDLDLAARHELSQALWLSLPLLAVLLAADFAVHVAENRGLAVTRPARSAAGAHLVELFSARSLALRGLQWLSMAALATYGWYWWRSHVHDVAATLTSAHKAQQLSAVTALHFAWVAGLIWCGCGCVDWAVARQSWLQQLKMSHAEKRQEQREAEGDPWLALHRHQLRQQSLTESVVSALQSATLVIHAGFEMAALLRYVPERDSAPRVLAVATGAMARRIIGDALSAGIPLVADPPLTRVLALRAPGSPISEAQYEKVASILGNLGKATSLDSKFSSGR